MMRAAWCALALLALAGCASLPEEQRSSAPKRPANGNSGRYSMDKDSAPLPEEIPANLGSIPEAVPKYEPPSASGNPETYNVLGETYAVRKSAQNFRERGFASWYGRKFQGHLTSSGERYDMFKMTGAHKTLPLPTYVRVTRVDNGKSVIVKVNDRGPFHSTRIIDLSYVAASRLDMIGHGSTEVEITAITPGPGAQPPPVPVPAPPPASVGPIPPAKVQRGWLQVATYDDPINAIALREDLNNAGVTPVEIWTGGNGASVNRVLVGPFNDPAASEVARQKLIARGLGADWVNE